MANTPDPLKSHDQMAEVPIFIFHPKEDRQCWIKNNNLNWNSLIFKSTNYTVLCRDLKS